jgi:diguanylate cyclase (GGDEF)-like protein
VLATVAIGILLSATADGLSLFWSATGHSGASAFDALWPASALVLGWAAWQPSRPAPFLTLEGRRLLVFPVAFALTAVGLLGIQRVHPLGGAAYLLAVATIAGVVARLGLIFTENLALVERSRREALTDVLTGLGNRRRLLLDLDDTVWTASVRSPKALLLFDLNGFKHYNDSFGHPVGDALLARLGAKLEEAIGAEGRAYRLGGDEFCVLTSVGTRSLEELVNATVQALSERDTGFDISTACGSIMLPAEAETTSTALQVVDERLYADKRSRSRTDAPEQCRDVLMQVLREREPKLYEHLSEVAFLAKSVGRALGLSGEDLDITVRAAELHDLGKVAVPDAILYKPAGLDPGERAVVERHAEVGERILSVAPALRPVARLVRASHERFDGAGYPDRRSGRDIPLGARIIAVCDAFHAMTSDRPYHVAIDVPQAMLELRHHGGSQFDPDVVAAFCRVVTAHVMEATPQRVRDEVFA